MARKFSELEAKMTPAARAKAQQMAAKIIAEMPLLQLRQARAFTQMTMAELMKTNQSQVSKIEHQADMYISTVRSYVEALGGRLDVIAHMPEGDIRISGFSKLALEPPTERKKNKKRALARTA